MENVDVETEELGFIVYFFFFLGEQVDEEGCQSCLLKACRQFIIVSSTFNVIAAVSQDNEATRIIRDVQDVAGGVQTSPTQHFRLANLYSGAVAALLPGHKRQLDVACAAQLWNQNDVELVKSG